jgi:hypothetical protein
MLIKTSIFSMLAGNNIEQCALLLPNRSSSHEELGKIVYLIKLHFEAYTS